MDDNYSVFRRYGGSHRPQRKLLLAGLIGCLVGVMPKGYHESVLNVSRPVVLGFFNATMIKDNGGAVPSRSELRSVWAIVVGSFGLGQIVGSLLVAITANRFGRKTTLFLGCGTLLLVGSIIQACTKPARSYAMLVVGRIIVGIGTGQAYGLLSLWLTESSPIPYRGLIASMINTSVAVGTLIAQILGLPQLLGSEAAWPGLLAFCGIVTIVGYVAHFYFPESPKYLYLVRSNVPDAIRSVEFYYGQEERAMTVLSQFEEEEQSTIPGTAILTPSLKECIMYHRYKMPLLVSSVVTMLPSMLGAYCMIAYTSFMFVELGLSYNAANAFTVAIMAAGVITALVAPFIVFHSKRRPLLLATGAAITIYNFLIFVFGTLHFRLEAVWPTFVVATICFFGASTYNIGVGTIAPFIASEISPQELRPLANAVAIGVLNTGFFISQTAFGATFEEIGIYSFLIFIVLAILALVFLYKTLPETKNRALNEVIEPWFKRDQEVLPLL